MKCRCGNDREGFTGTLNLEAIGYRIITNLCESCYMGFTAQVRGDLKDDEGYIQVDGEEKEILKLKEELRTINNKGIVESYKILHKIFAIRKRVHKNYNFKDLSEEQVINEIFSYEQIFYIFRLQYFSSYAMDLIKDKKITVGLVCTLIMKNAAFQEEANQVKILSLLMEGKLKRVDIQNLNSIELKKKARMEVSEKEEKETDQLVNHHLLTYLDRIVYFMTENSSKFTENAKIKAKEKIGKMREVLN